MDIWFDITFAKAAPDFTAVSGSGPAKTRLQMSAGLVSRVYTSKLGSVCKSRAIPRNKDGNAAHHEAALHADRPLKAVLAALGFQVHKQMPCDSVVIPKFFLSVSSGPADS
jgi:hypothetical protein